MFNEKTTKKALKLIYKSYLNELEDGVYKVFKLYDAASKLTTNEEKCVALLSSMLDDKKISFKNLQKEFPFEISEAVRLLSKDDVLAYPDFIRRIKTNPLAKRVKIVLLEEEIKTLNDSKAETEKFALKILKG